MSIQHSTKSFGNNVEHSLTDEDGNHIASFNTEDFRIMRGGWLDDFWLLTMAKGDYEKVAGEINRKRFSVKAGDTSYRIINHWTQQGLFHDERDEDSKDWRKLSLKDALWLRIARDLRKFGLPLETLRTTFNTLVTRRGKPHNSLEMAIILCSQKTPVFVMVLDDGFADIVVHDSIKFMELVGGYKSYLLINVNNIWREIMGDTEGKYIAEPPMAVAVAKSEAEALTALRNKANDAVKVHLQGGNITRIDTTKQVDGAERIADLLKETNFGEVTVKVENGKAVHTEMVKKAKPK